MRGKPVCSGRRRFAMGRPQFYPKDRQEIALVPAIRALERYREA
ncbi:hypothetical protein ALP65_00249 [Pseudomonas aeruginosa]|uniref:Uncharacterized protein n=2 Tax=Pseudomonas aeruginosa TaxID=287 RepID=A0A3M5EEY6_PSEAI|nr:hypothetical protein ALP65_00249 [Pseudomonas aeruginosa]